MFTNTKNSTKTNGRTASVNGGNNINCIFYNEMRPVFWGLRLMYKFPYSITPQGDFKVKYISLWMLYTIGMYVLLTYAGALVVLEVYDDYLASYTLDKLLMGLATSGFLCFHFQSPLAFIIESKAMADYVNAWKEFELEFWKTTGVKLQPGVGRWTLLQSTDRGVLLAKQRILWVKLSELTQEAGGAIGRTLVLEIAVFIMVVIISAYNTLITLIDWGSLSSPTPYFVLAFVYFFFVATFNLYFISASAHSATDEVGITFAADLFYLDMSTVDLNSKFNIIEFIDTIYLKQPKIDLGGFFTINRQLFLSYFSNTITYLIALGQFKASEKKQ